MKKTNFRILILIFLTVSLAACTKKSRFNINTQDNRINVKIKRFDRDLLSMDTANIRTAVVDLYKHYPEFMSVYTLNLLDTTINDTNAVCQRFKQYLSDKDFAPMNNKAKSAFVDVSDIEQKISNAYTYIHHYFPEVQLPEVYFFVSGFNQQIMISEKFIGIGTDFYLGSDFSLYPKLTYQYMIPNMRRENLATDLVSATLFRMFLMNSDKNCLLDNMIFRGKVMYLQSVFMPEEKPEILMGYTTEQWEWSTKYEKNIYSAIIDQKHLFSTDVQLIRKYLNDAPFTATISQESPGRLGTYIGWKIVKSYMEKNKKIELKDLMNEDNSQKILEKSGYRP